jgi:hypothetical protein
MIATPSPLPALAYRPTRRTFGMTVPSGPWTTISTVSRGAAGRFLPASSPQIKIPITQIAAGRYLFTGRPLYRPT